MFIFLWPGQRLGCWLVLIDYYLLLFCQCSAVVNKCGVCSLIHSSYGSDDKEKGSDGSAIKNKGIHVIGQLPRDVTKWQAGELCERAGQVSGPCVYVCV